MNQALLSIGCGIAAVFCLAPLALARIRETTPPRATAWSWNTGSRAMPATRRATAATENCERQPGFVEGRHGQCLTLNGAGDYADSLLPLADLGDTFTVECWVKPDSQQNIHANIFGNHAHGGLGFVMQQDDANPNRFVVSYGTGAGQWITTRAVQFSAAGKWQHVALVKTPETLSFFLNGVAVAPVPATPGGCFADDVARGVGLRHSERWGVCALLPREHRRVPRVEQGGHGFRP